MGTDSPHAVLAAARSPGGGAPLLAGHRKARARRAARDSGSVGRSRRLRVFEERLQILRGILGRPMIQAVQSGLVDRLVVGEVLSEHANKAAHHSI